jgi:hypothetical protein
MIVIRHDPPYTVAKLRELESRSRHKLMVCYRRSDTFTYCGPVLTIYVSTAGHDCVDVAGFGAPTRCSRITGHYYEESGS